jgi:hypothetical protein
MILEAVEVRLPYATPDLRGSENNFWSIMVYGKKVTQKVTNTKKDLTAIG